MQANGHELRSYPQTSKTWLHGRDAGASHLSTAPWLAPRRCLVTATRVDSLGAALFANGAAQHGSMPNGNLDTGYTRIGIHDTPGPWLYYAASDTWEDTRLLPPLWEERAHGQLTYDPSSDLVVYLGPSALGLYSPHPTTR